MRLKNSLPDVRQACYLLHVRTVPDAYGPVAAPLPPPPPICSPMLGTIDPLLPPCITEGETESWSSVLRDYKASTEQGQPKFLNSQLDTHLASPQICVMVWGLGVLTSFLR